ncbi:hypothetical protein GCM10007170_11640 [Arthrobacter liuii]|uniref:Uncharacterized protein n=1 Tax=Arthrobacter liuii TaxID=1476996 RepID=A0ABQ2AMT7_9MICC|nr:hypothetical protein GCM10007170_11640 [Arthrobacter liuii]
MAEGDAGDARGLAGARLGLHLACVPEGEHQAVVHLDKKHLPGNLPMDGPAKAVNVEGAGFRNVADTKRDKVDSGLHASILSDDGDNSRKR